MESFSSQHEQQLHQSSALPYCLLSEPHPLPIPAFLEAAAAAAAMAYESSSNSSLDTSSMSMVYSPVVLQLQEKPPSFEPAGADKKRMVAGIQGKSSTSSLSSAQEMDGSGGKSRKHKRNNVGDIVKGLEEKKARSAKEAGGEPPAGAGTGYIHVRARRGQATDSHSLAERVRREKISERMKMLQSMVPGCDKVTGKALMLDEIISYVQSLQNQVEFLSMRLASLSPMMYEYELGIGMYPDVPQLVKMPHEVVQCVGQGDQQLPTATGAAHMISLQGPTGFAQDYGSSHMNVVMMPEGEQVELSSMGLFQQQ